MSSLDFRDQQTVWHPYFQHGLNQPIWPVVSGQGAYLKLSNGKEVLDGISSWWVNLHGHAHLGIARAIAEQAQKLEHVIFSGFTHEPAIRLAETLTQYPRIRDLGLTKVFYSDNGSTAIEVALKMAYQYHYNRGERNRARFIALRNSYHGDTLGAMAVGEPEGFHQPFRKLMPEVDFVEAGQLDQLQQLLRNRPNEYAAFIFEPLLQGAGGMQIYDQRYLEEAIAVCRHASVLTIADEVFTGFYRTGRCFAFEHGNIQPDLLCLSKGITAGFLPLAVTLATETVFEAFLSQEVRTAFLHGHSYTANPLPCAAALESWKILQTPECRAQIEMITSLTEARVHKLGMLPGVHSARSLGTVGALDLGDAAGYFSKLARLMPSFALDRNVLLRPLGHVLYAVPPYCCTAEEINRLYDVMEEFILQSRK
jgi:adenosylmethionine-8-amino-7-oxononanoate aminotransferase